MKRIAYLFSVITLFSGVLLYSCDTAATDDTTDNDVKDTVVIEQNNTNNTDATVRVATTEEWTAFKTDAEQRIEANEKRIEELKVKLKKPGKLLDKMYEDRIANLRERNRELRAKIAGYETTQTDWEKFKSEFNHDMNELGKAIDDIFTDNK